MKLGRRLCINYKNLDNTFSEVHFIQYTILTSSFNRNLLVVYKCLELIELKEIYVKINFSSILGSQVSILTNNLSQGMLKSNNSLVDKFLEEK